MTCGIPTANSHMKAFQYLKADYLSVSFNLSEIHKHLSMFLIKDETHIRDIAHIPLYNKAYLFRPLV